MNGIDRIRDRMERDARAERDAIRAEGEQQAAALAAQYRAQAEELAKQAAARREQTAAESLRQADSADQLERRQCLLAERQRCIDLAFEQAASQLRTLPQEQYVQVLAHIAAETGTGSEELIFSPADREAVGAQVTERANALKPGAAFRLSAETRETGGGVVLKAGDIVPGNSHFDTTKGHIEGRRALALDCTIDEAKQTQLEIPFKGNVDPKKLEKALQEHSERIPFVIVTITNNTAGGQPVSMQNLREVRAIADKYGSYWHASTMRISVNHDFERRVGLFPAGFDNDGVLYCNQNFADYPHEIPAGKFDAASQQPKWMLLSYRKTVTASSTAEGSDPVNAVDEDCRRWWSAGSDQPGEWLCVDLGRDCDVRAVQVNMADEALAVDFPADSYGDDRKTRHIETRPQISHYTVETSLDGKVWTLREDIARECSNGYYEYADGIRARYIRVTGGELPYGQALRISGLRVFGNGEGACPAQADAKAVRVDALDGKISWQPIENAQGCNVRYGIAPDKLYQSWLVYDADEVTLSTLMSGQTYYVCVDSFNENGITTGKIIKMEG